MSQLLENGECVAKQNGWPYKHELEWPYESSMVNNHLCENDSETDNKGEYYLDDENDEKIEDDDLVLPVCLNVDGRIEHAQNFDAAVCREDSMLVESDGDKLKGTVDFKKNFITYERNKFHGINLDELLALYEQGGSLEDDEDDNGWSPYGYFSICTKCFFINC